MPHWVLLPPLIIAMALLQLLLLMVRKHLTVAFTARPGAGRLPIFAVTLLPPAVRSTWKWIYLPRLLLSEFADLLISDAIQQHNKLMLLFVTPQLLIIAMVLLQLLLLMVRKLLTVVFT